MKTALLICVVAFFVLYALLLTLRASLASLEDRAQGLVDRADP
jgi:hypothetical protein